MTDRRLIDPLDTEGTIQQVRLEQYQDNLEGALEILGDAYATFPSPRYSAEAAKVRDWLRHLQTRETYVSAYEKYYQSVKLGLGLQMPDRAFRTLTGRRTRKMVERFAENTEYRLLEREALASAGHSSKAPRFLASLPAGALVRSPCCHLRLRL